MDSKTSQPASKHQEESNAFWIFWGTGLFLGVGAGWLVWPVLAVALLFYGCYRWIPGRAKWIAAGLFLFAMAGGVTWIASQEGTMATSGRLYMRLQWELLLIGWSYFSTHTGAPAGSILLTHLRQIPTLAVSFAFGPLLGILLASTVPPADSSRDSSGDTLPAKREGAKGGKSGEETAPEPVEPRWYTGDDFAEMSPSRRIEVWGAGVLVGAVTGWIGAPKVGKSEAYTQLIACCILGIPFFLGVRVYPTAVVVLAEETAEVYRDKALTAGGWLDAVSVSGPSWLRPFKLTRRRVARKTKRLYTTKIRKQRVRDVHVICGKEMPGLKDVDNFPVFLALAMKRARLVGAKLIVVDSLNFWVPQAITNDTIAKQAAAHLSHVAAQGFAVLIVHHMNKKGEMAGPDSLYSQLDFRVDCTVPGDADPRTTDVRQLLWSGRFKRDYPQEKRQQVFRMTDGKLVAVRGSVTVLPGYSLEGESQEPDADDPETWDTLQHITRGSLRRKLVGEPGEPGEETAEAEVAMDPVCTYMAKLLRNPDFAAPETWQTADQIIRCVQNDGKYSGAGRIREHLNHLVAAGNMDRDKEKGVRGDPVRYRPHVETPETGDSGHHSTPPDGAISGAPEQPAGGNPPPKRASRRTVRSAAGAGATV